MNKKLAAVALAGLAFVAAACGGRGENNTAIGGSGSAKTVAIEMIDIAFKPAKITLAEGEDVRFVFTNNGRARHEAYVGTVDEQLAHETEMRAGGDDGAGHGGHGGGVGDNSKVTVDPGESGELTIRFDNPGTYEIGCHELGHYDGGMKITVEVT